VRRSKFAQTLRLRGGPGEDRLAAQPAVQVIGQCLGRAVAPLRLLLLAQQPDVLTQLGWALKFYDVSLLYAPTPQAKGKVERLQLFWQNRLPALFAAESVNDVPQANPWVAQLRQHHNLQEKHRELTMTPHQAWTLAQKEGRCVLRPKPACPWWSYVWSLRVQVRVADDGTVPLGSQRLKISVPPGTKVVRCQHPDGSYSVLAQPPAKDTKPRLLLRYGPAQIP
jgi:hypothetical protein